jgi:hypothetical protein
MEFISAMFLLVISVGVYFLPTLIAQHRHNKNLGAIIVVNLFLGWTFIGWVVALAWAVIEDKE